MKYNMAYMALIITASILLSSCTDSKESKHSKPNNDTLQFASRVVAMKYQVIDLEKNSDTDITSTANTQQAVPCFFNITHKERGHVTLKSGQIVLLAEGSNFATINKVSWLRISPELGSEQDCYVETRYLSPVPEQ